MCVTDIELKRLVRDFGGKEWDITEDDGYVVAVAADGRKLQASAPAVMRVFLADDAARNRHRRPGVAEVLAGDAAFTAVCRNVVPQHI